VAPASAIKSTSKACLAGTPDADRRIGYLAKYMTKSMTEAADPASDTQRAQSSGWPPLSLSSPAHPACRDAARSEARTRGASSRAQRGCLD
jgi:hypothetical protein